MATIDKKKLIEAYKDVDLFRAKYRHNDFTPYAWCFHGNQSQEWDGACKNRRLEIKGSTELHKEIDANNYKHVSLYIDLPDYWYKEEERTSLLNGVQVKSIYLRQILRPAGYTCQINIGYGAGKQSIKVNGSSKLVYLDMTDDVNWTGLVEPISIDILPIDRDGNLLEDSSFVPIGLLEYFKVDQINVFATMGRNATVVSKDVNTLRDIVESLNKGYYNAACNMGNTEYYTRKAGPCGNSDTIVIGRPSTKVPDSPSLEPRDVDWGAPGPADDIIDSFIDKIKKADFTSLSSTIKALPPYNGCSTCDLHQCDCYAVHYGRIECQACDSCNQHSPCTVGCDIGCYTQAKSCSCDRGCYTQPKACSCNGTCYSYSSCKCNQRYYD